LASLLAFAYSAYDLLEEEKMWVLCVLMLVNGKAVCLPTADSADLKYPTFLQCEIQRGKVPVEIRTSLGLECMEGKVNDTDVLVQ